MRAPFPYFNQKGKLYKDLTAKDLSYVPHKVYVKSTKYDGNRIFITKVGTETRVFTSDWKELTFPSTSNKLNILEPLIFNLLDFVIEAEFMLGCKGKLGDRGKSAILTTFRTNFNKGLSPLYDKCVHQFNIKLFDLVPISNGQLSTYLTYIERLNIAKQLTLPSFIEVIPHELVMGTSILEYTKRAVAEGWEGCMFVDKDAPYQLGLNSHKRTSYIIKNKARPTADLKCIDVEEGTGKYTGLVGSLVLKDSTGRIVKVGSGLTDDQRQLSTKFFIGKVVEISYEQIKDTYLQPVFVTVREDKSVWEID